MGKIYSRSDHHFRNMLGTKIKWKHLIVHFFLFVLLQHCLCNEIKTGRYNWKDRSRKVKHIQCSSPHKSTMWGLHPGCRLRCAKHCIERTVIKAFYSFAKPFPLWLSIKVWSHALFFFPQYHQDMRLFIFNQAY